MRVKVKFAGFRELPPGFEGPKEGFVNFSGSSVKDLIHQLSSTMGSESRELFLDRDEISPDLQVIINGILVSDSNRFNLRLNEGDLVELVSSPG